MEPVHLAEDVVGERAPQEVTMNPCPKCSSLMVIAAFYDPDGMIPLHGGILDYSGSPIWVCINPQCEDGRRNVPK